MTKDATETTQSERRTSVNHEKLVLFFSRGRGRGHAMTDLGIIESLPEFAERINLQFVSYGTGAATFRERGYPVIDLGLADANTLFEVLVRAAKVIKDYSPALVISHEDIVVPVAANVFGCPSIFITDWFYALDHVLNEPLAYVDSILFIGPAGIFPEPSTAKGKTQYFGSIVRSMSYTKGDKKRARRELNIDEEAVVISVIPGAWATEARAPLVALLAPAFEALNYERKHLIWVAGNEAESISAQLRVVPNAHVLSSCWPTDRLLVASDLVITKTNRGSLIEAAALGIRTLSITYGANPIDEVYALHIHSGVVLHHKGVESATLAGYMAAEVEQGADHEGGMFRLRTGDPRSVARALLERLELRLAQRTVAAEVSKIDEPICTTASLSS